MKKLLLMLMLSLSIGIAANAQDSKDKVKPTSTVPQKVHNTFSKHKKHKGYKTKHTQNGTIAKKKVNAEKGKEKDKIK